MQRKKIRRTAQNPGAVRRAAALAGADRSIIDLLLAYGSEINSPSNAGTPLDCAQLEGHAETIEHLQSLGARTRHEVDEAW